jgi:hypothetical protein
MNLPVSTAVENFSHSVKVTIDFVFTELNMKLHEYDIIEINSSNYHYILTRIKSENKNSEILKVVFL